MTIKDELLGKYEIEWTDSYTVREPTCMTTNKEGKEVMQYKNHGYYSTKEGALKGCCDLLLKDALENQGKVTTIKNMYQTQLDIWNNLKALINI